MTEYPDWRNRLIDKAWKQPQFFQQLLDNRENPASLLEEAGISLSETELGELRAVLSADRLKVELDWDEVSNLVEQGLGENARVWPELRPWLGGVWRP